ncbi:MAG: VOC family protein [Acidimicrobiia bacterium]|nr:VOC family protein [Acidimicrobiia bacterium]
MKPQLNHLIVWSRDRNAAAAFFAEVMGMDEPTESGHFTQVETGNGVTIDFAGVTGEPNGMHLAFQVTEREFDEIHGRIVERGIPHWADPRRSKPNMINHHDGGRGVYFSDPYTKVGWEIITRPYGSGPLGEQHSSPR